MAVSMSHARRAVLALSFSHLGSQQLDWQEGRPARSTSGPGPRFEGPWP